MLTIKLRIQLLFFLNRIFKRCRMYEKKPAKPEILCSRCAEKGGYFLCRRSRGLKKEGA